MAEKEIPDEIIELLKRKWKEMSSSTSTDHEQSDPKRGKYTEHQRCKNCTCYSCCRHMWICKHCSIKKEVFHKWTNQDRQEKERRERARKRAAGGSKGGESKGGESSGRSIEDKEKN